MEMQDSENNADGGKLFRSFALSLGVDYRTVPVGDGKGLAMQPDPESFGGADDAKQEQQQPVDESSVTKDVSW